MDYKERHLFVMRIFARLIIFTILLSLFFLKAPSVHAQVLNNFSFTDTAGWSTKTAGVSFPITITARDGSNNTLATFNETVDLTDTTGTITPTQVNFTNGVWSGYINIIRATTSTLITASEGLINSNSNSFQVNADTRIKFLYIVSGNNQSNAVATVLPNALTVKVVDPYNNPLSSIGVNFSLTSSPVGATGASLTPTSDTSDASGLASTALTLGNKSGSYIVTAGLSSGITNAVTFYSTAIPGQLISFSLSPSVAIVPAGGYLPFTAIGYDQYGNQNTPTPITWSVQNGGGTIDATGVFYAGGYIGNYLNTVKAVYGSVGSTATVSVIGAAGLVDGSATASGTPQLTPFPTVLVTPTPPPGLLYDITIDPDVITALKNATIPIVAEGVDIYGNTATGVTYSFQVEGDLGTITQTGANTALLSTGESGLGSVTVTATQGGITQTARIVGSVGNGNNRRLVIEAIESPQTAGAPFTLSIAAKDTSNNFVTDYEGPIVLADTTGTIDPAVVQPSENGIWYVQVVIGLAHPEVSITAAGDGMVGVSNIFEVIGQPEAGDLTLGGLGAGEVLGASISALIDQLLQDKDINKFTIFRYIGGGIAAGFGILGSSIGGGIMVSRGLEAIGRNPFAKTRLQANLYASLVAFIIAAALAVLATFLILK